MDFKQALTKYNHGDFRGAASRLAKELQVSTPLVSGWVKHGRLPSDKMVRELARVFKLPIEAVEAMFSRKSSASSGVEGSRSSNDLPLIPVRGLVSANRYSEVYDAPDQMVPNPYPNRKDVIAARVAGDCMKPTLLHGEVVIVLTNAEAQHKKIVLALLDGEEMIKRYMIIDGVPWLVPDNKKYARTKVTAKTVIRGVVDSAVTIRRNL